MLPNRIARPNWRLLALIIAALAVRLLLMPVAAYGDMHAIAYALHLLGFQGIANVYAALHVLPLEQSPVPNLGIDFFPYPPLTYFVLGGAMAFLRPLYGDGFSSAVSSLFPAFVAHPPRTNVTPVRRLSLD